MDSRDTGRSDPYRHIVELALAQTVNGVVVSDATLPDRPIVHVNEGFSRITGYSAAEVLGRNCKFLQGTDTEQTAIATMRQALDRHEAVTVVLRNYRKDGTMFWNQVEMNPVRDPSTGEVTHFFALQTDITHRRQAEERAQLRALEVERMLSASPMGMLTFDRDERIKLINPALSRLFPLNDDPMRSHSLDDWHRQLCQQLGQAQDQLPWPAQGGTSLWRLESPAHRVLEVSLAWSGDDSGDRLITFRDVTQEQDQHASQSAFLATAAHELRTPLGSICGFTELMLMRRYSSEQARPLLETVLSQATRLNALINDLLDLSRMDALGAEAFALQPTLAAEVMQRTAQLIEGTLQAPGQDRRLDLQLPDADLHVHAHPQKLEQVLINLLSNAVKYSPGGGAVQLRASLDADPHWLRIDVQDHGLGLSPEHVSRLFTRFFRAHPNSSISGTGLGLVIVKELVERMGGRISVHSELGIGSTFSVHLKVCASSAPTKGQP